MKKNDKDMVDVTQEMFGTKNEPTKEAPKKDDKAKIETAVEASTEPLPEGFEPINPPAKKDSLPKNIVPAEVKDRQVELDKLFKDVVRNFIRIGFHLLHFQQTKEFKALGYSRFEDFVKSEYSLSKSTAYNFIKCCVKYSVKDDEGKPTTILAKEYAKYSISQLIALLGMNEDFIAQTDPTKTAREIKNEIKRSLTTDGYFDPDTGKNYDAFGNEIPDKPESDPENPDGKAKKKNARDMTIPVMRISMARGQTWEEVITDKVRDACVRYLSDEKRAEDGNDYMIELCITYPDKTAI